MTDPATIPHHTIQADCCIVGGGPAGMMLGYLLARAGVHTVVLEKHADFLRDFRGDTVHPSTLRVMDELGLLDDFLKLPHEKLDHIEAEVGDARITIADFRRLKMRTPYVAFMPQWDFLNFLVERGRRFLHLDLLMQAEVTDLLRDGHRIAGVHATTPKGSIEVRAKLTVGADGRHSTVRRLAGLAPRNVGAPIDVLWFRVSRDAAAFDQTFGRIQQGRMMVTLDRGDYWQCAYVIPKGGADRVKARGLAAFRAEVTEAAPALRAHIDEVKSWDDVKLLTVMIDRLRRWSSPGLLCIGDAAHAMSPVGGVGINLAVQDAVAAANLLAAKLRRGEPDPHDLDAVRRRRLLPTKIIQALQITIQNRLLAPTITGRDMRRTFAVMRVYNRLPWLHGIPARLLGLGPRPEHVRTPAEQERP